MSDKYTVVQHSAFGYKSDVQFSKGLESRKVTETQGKTITDYGGKVFDSYGDAEAFCMEETYPEDYTGLAPRAPGTFGRMRIDSLRIYIPPKEA